MKITRLKKLLEKGEFECSCGEKVSLVNSPECAMGSVRCPKCGKVHSQTGMGEMASARDARELSAVADAETVKVGGKDFGRKEPGFVGKWWAKHKGSIVKSAVAAVGLGDLDDATGGTDLVLGKLQHGKKEAHKRAAGLHQAAAKSYGLLKGHEESSVRREAAEKEDYHRGMAQKHLGLAEGKMGVREQVLRCKRLVEGRV